MASQASSRCVQTWQPGLWLWKRMLQGQHERQRPLYSTMQPATILTCACLARRAQAATCEQPLAFRARADVSTACFRRCDCVRGTCTCRCLHAGTRRAANSRKQRLEPQASLAVRAPCQAPRPVRTRIRPMQWCSRAFCRSPALLRRCPTCSRVAHFLPASGHHVVSVSLHAVLCCTMLPDSGCAV